MTEGKRQISIKSFFQRSQAAHGSYESSPPPLSAATEPIPSLQINQNSQEDTLTLMDSLPVPCSQGVMPECDGMLSVGGDSSLASYEKIREENIRRNCDFLRRLGLTEVSIPRPVGERRKGQKRRSHQGNEEHHPPIPKRIQPKRGVKTAVPVELPLHPSGDSGDEEEGISDKEVEGGDHSFEDSSVLRYVISVGSEGESEELPPLSDTNCQHLVPTLRPLPSLQSEYLSAVYSLHPHPAIPSLIVAAGKGGQVAIYSIPQSSDKSSPTLTSPLLDFRAHSRWISSANFFSNSKSIDQKAHILLLTAADDGLLKLWDIAQCNRSCDPKILCSVSLHDRGIFAMDERDEQVLTGSKDRSVSISRIQSSGEVQRVQSFLDLHASVVKSVQWKPSEVDCPPQVFASGGQDCSIFIQDIRSASPDLHISSAHEGGVHTVSWCPATSVGGDYLLMSAGYDSSVKIFDLRLCGGPTCSPLHSFRDHSSQLSKRSSITTPSFLTSQYLLIPNEHSSSISIHCTLTGRTLSRGTLEEQPLSVACSRFLTPDGLPRFAVAACKRKGVLIPFRVTHSSMVSCVS